VFIKILERPKDNESLTTNINIISMNEVTEIKYSYQNLKERDLDIEEEGSFEILYKSGERTFVNIVPHLTLQIIDKEGKARAFTSEEVEKFIDAFVTVSVEEQLHNNSSKSIN